MRELTHQKAQTLLQAVSDQSLATDERPALEAHLAQCKECGDYANSLANLEANLCRAARARWDAQRPNLNLYAIVHPSPAKLIWNNFLGRTDVLGKATIVAALLLGYILIANLFGLQSLVSNHETPVMAPTPNESPLFFTTSPTPVAQLTLAGWTPNNCKTVIYVVRANDTLESIAIQHGITKEAILEYNNLASGTVFTGMELTIPLCLSTPSYTVTTTITPLNGTILPVQPE